MEPGSIAARQSGTQDGLLSPPQLMASAQKTAPKKAHGMLPKQRELRPGQAGLAWERLKRAVRDHCTHPGHAPLAVSTYGGTIAFGGSTEDGPLITLVREDCQILKCMGGTVETIRIVRLKTGGVGFELRGHRHSATRLVIELACEARQS